MKSLASFVSRCLLLILCAAGSAYGAADEVVISQSEMTISKTNFVGQQSIRKVTMPATLQYEDTAVGFHFLQCAGKVEDARTVLEDVGRTEVTRAEYLYAKYPTHALRSKTSYAYVTYLNLTEGETIEFSARFFDLTTIAIDGDILFDEATYVTRTVTFTADSTRRYEVFISCYVQDGDWSDADCYGNIRFRLDGGEWQEFDAEQVPNRFYLLSDELNDLSMSLKALFPDSYQNITNVTLTGDAEELPTGFFADCAAVQEVTLPSTLLSLGLADLWPCAPLVTNGVFISYRDWIVGCTDSTLTSLEIPEGSVRIGTEAFSKMKNLSSVKFSSTLRTIGTRAFAEDVRLTRIDIPAGVKTIGVSAFEDCTAVDEIAFAEGVRSIRASAFENCALVRSIKLPQSLRDVRARAFADNWRMLSVSLPAGITNLVSSAFSGCKGVTGATVPTHLGTLSSLLPDAWNQIGDLKIADGETSIADDFFKECTSLKSISILPSITNIGESAFVSCAGLTEIMLPTSVVAIGKSAFSGCTSLAALKLSAGLVEIGASAFAGCEFESVVVPTTVRRIGASAFPTTCACAYYLGNAPSCTGDPYVNEQAVSYVTNGSTNWDGVDGSTTLPETWQGHAIDFWSPNRLEVVFDACGGAFRLNGTLLQSYKVEEITGTDYALPPLTPVDTNGLVFAGWWTERSGGAQVTGLTKVTSVSGHTLYAHWAAEGATVTIRFNACGGTVEPTSSAYEPERPYGTLPVATRDGYSFAGWFTAAEEGTAVDESSFVSTQDGELFAHWTPITYSVLYNSNGGTGTMSAQTLTYGVAATLADCAFACTGHTFAGWSLSPTGNVDYAANDMVLNLRKTQDDTITLYAVWAEVVNSYVVRFDANGGTGTMTNQTFSVGEQKSLARCAFVCDGLFFAGWSLFPESEVVYADGETVCDLAAKDAAVTLYAQWRRHDVDDFDDPYSPSAAPFAGKATYSGWICDADGNLTGLVTLKAQKANAKTGLSKVKATVKWLDGSNSTTLNGSAAVGSVSEVKLANKSGDSLMVTLSRDSMAADATDISLRGTSLPFSGTEGNYAVSLMSGGEKILFALSVGKKGKTRVVALMPSGKSLAATCQAVTGEDGCWCVPVVISKPALRVGFLAWFKGAELTSVAGTAWTVETAACGSMTGLSGQATFSVSGVEDLLPGVLVDYLPTNQLLTVNGRWTTVDKAGKVKYDKKLGELIVTTGNPSALKLTYAAKTGLFTGSFKAYVANGTRLKSKTFKVRGLCVNGQGIGFATLLGQSVPVAIVQ